MLNTATKLSNFLYYLVCLIVAVVNTFPANWAVSVPPNVKPYVIGSVILATWLKSHWNLFVNPNGTPAETAWNPDDKTGNQPPPADPPPAVTKATAAGALLLVALMLTSSTSTACRAVTTPPPPTSTTLARASEALSVALAGAEKTVKSLRASGQITEADTIAVQGCLRAAIQADQKMNAILKTTGGHDLTTDQKLQIGQVWTSATLMQVAGTLKPQAADILKGIITAANTVLAAIGVPTL